MIRRFLVIALLAIGATVSQAQSTLPSSFQAKTVALIRNFLDSPDAWQAATRLAD